MTDDTQLRTTFNRQARLYHEIRPRYPQPLFEALVEVTCLPATASLLEIGPGTGQATEPLAQRGYQITAIEIGSALAQFARQALKKYPNVQVLIGSFEQVALPLKSFDLVYAATAFHWINPEVRFKKPYDLLKDDGSLAIIHTNHVSDEAGDEFFFASQPVYKAYGLDEPPADLRLPTTAGLQPDALDTALFSLRFFKAYPLVVSYSASEYTKLISTYSPTIAMPAAMRAGFLSDLASLIDIKFGGSIKKHFAMTLTVAGKAA